MRTLFNIWLFALLISLGARGMAAQATVAVAANFLPTAKALVAALEQQSGHRYRLAGGSTGSLDAQIRNGAPFDVFLAADSETPARLERDGWGMSGTRFTYASGQLVLWSADSTLIDSRGEVLRTQRFQKLALANPKIAPYGAAAMATLTQLGLASVLTPRLVQGESVGQTLSFVASGNAQIGFVALAQVMQEGRLRAGSMWLVPSQLYPPIRQDAIVLRQGGDNPAAQALIAALKSDAGRQLMKAHGYIP